MCAIGMFVAVYAVSLVLGSPNKQHHQGLRRPLAAFRYLSYRAFRLDSIQWNSAPIGLLLLAVIGIVYFFCEFHTLQLSLLDTSDADYMAPQVWTWYHSHTTGQI